MSTRAGEYKSIQLAPESQSLSNTLIYRRDQKIILIYLDIFQAYFNGIIAAQISEAFSQFNSDP